MTLEVRLLEQNWARRCVIVCIVLCVIGRRLVALGISLNSVSTQRFQMVFLARTCALDRPVPYRESLASFVVLQSTTFLLVVAFVRFVQMTTR